MAEVVTLAEAADALQELRTLAREGRLQPAECLHLVKRVTNPLESFRRWAELAEAAAAAELEAAETGEAPPVRFARGGLFVFDGGRA